MKETIAEILAKETKLSKKEIMNALETPPSSNLGDYAFPTFFLSKKLKKNPKEIAEDIAKKIKSSDFEKIEAKGPYVNFFLNKVSIANSLLSRILKEREKYGSSKKREKVVIESPGPNTNKPLHIGHARNIILAQSVKKILEFQGNEVKITDIINDRGVHICKSMVAYTKFGKNSTPQTAKKKPDHFIGDFYVKYAEAEKKDESLKESITECLKKWEAGDQKTIILWKKMNSWALEGFAETYKKFDLKIAKAYPESETYKGGKKIVLDQLKKGNLKKNSEGAIVADLKTQGLGEKVLLRADGTSIYITQDLNLAVLRKKEMKFDRMLYVVANEQNYHFKVLFTLLKKFGYGWANRLEHLNYGLVHLESGRMKSREGTVVDSDDLIEDLTSLASKEVTSRYPNLAAKEKKERANAIAMAALRYYFLKVDRSRDLIFKPKESISFEGNTGPYLLYTYARAKSILRKAKYTSEKASKTKDLEKTEKELIMKLSTFPDMAEQAHLKLAPSIIANYSFQLAQIFNEFYHANKVIGSEKEEFRLVLVDAFSQVLKNALNLLHIDTLENM